MLVIIPKLFRKFRQFILKFLRQNSCRISSLKQASKLASIVLILFLIPVSIFPTQRDTYNANNAKQTTVRLDKNNPFVLSEPDLKINIISGRSRYDLERFGLKHDSSQIKLLIQELAPQYGIDWRLVYAIGYLESANFNSSLARYQNNFFGRKASSGVYASWPDPETAVQNQLEYLKTRYIDQGLDTPWEMNRVYAESPLWATKVVAIMKTLYY